MKKYLFTLLFVVLSLPIVVLAQVEIEVLDVYEISPNYHGGYNGFMSYPPNVPIIINTDDGVYEYDIQNGFQEISFSKNYVRVFRNESFVYGITTDTLDIFDANYNPVNSLPIYTGSYNGWTSAGASVIWSENLQAFIITGVGTGDITRYLLQDEQFSVIEVIPGNGLLQTILPTYIYESPASTTIITPGILIGNSSFTTFFNYESGETYSLTGFSPFAIMEEFAYANTQEDIVRLNIDVGLQSIETLMEEELIIRVLNFGEILIGSASIQVNGMQFYACIIDRDGVLTGTEEFGYNSDFSWRSTDDAPTISPNVMYIPGTDNEFLVPLGFLRTPAIETDNNIIVRLKLTISPETTTEGILDEIEINLSPNPASDILNVEIPTQIQVENIKILNALGSCVRELSYTSNQIDVSDLSSGIYSIVFTTENESVLTRNFIKK